MAAWGGGSELELMAGDQTVWADSTGFISRVCEGLNPGELVHGENFSLFEAMAALEIMDPKMDAGMDIGGPKSVEEAIASGMAPIDLNIAQVLDVMDHLLSCEATWHRGHSLAQTVFSSIYMLKMDITSSVPILHAYCKIVRATCSIVRVAVSLAHTHEEEDLFTIAFGLPVDQTDGDCLAVLNSVEEACARQLRAAENKSGKKKVTEEVQPLQENPAVESDYCQNVLNRLRFRKAFYQALVHMDKPQGRGLETARKHISAALLELSSMRASSSFLSSHLPLQNPQDRPSTTASGGSPVGFDENINRSLLPPTPPRSMKLLCWTEALDYFERLLHDLDRVCSVPLHLKLEVLLQLIADFQKSHPDLVARARMQLLLLQDNRLFGMQPMADVIYNSIYSQRDLIIRDPGLEKFLEQAGWLTVNLLKILCANPAWQCRKLGKILEDWSNLFQQVDVLLEDPSQEVKDKASREGPIVTWIACQASWITKQYLMLGFELDLYSSNEYCMIYWYLDHVLLTFLHYKLEREKAMIPEQKTPEPAESTKKKGKKKKGPPKGAGKDLRLTTNFVFLQCLSDLCKGFIWMLVALTRDRKVIHRQMLFNSEQERYMQRFELLHKTLIPSPLSFYHFKEATKLDGYSVKELYQLSYEHFLAVQQHLQELGHAQAESPELSLVQKVIEIRQLEQVALRNRVALQIIHKAGPGDTLKVSFQFTQHPSFPVVVVKNSS